MVLDKEADNYRPIYLQNFGVLQFRIILMVYP